MIGALLLPQVMVAAVLITSGVAKLRAPLDVQAGFAAMGVPDCLSTAALRVVFPWYEIVLGVLLLRTGGWALAAAAGVATALMMLYSLLVLRAVRSGEPAECACFGTFSTGSVSRVAVIRNTLLMVAAVLVFVQGVTGGGLPTWVSDSDPLGGRGCRPADR